MKKRITPLHEGNFLLFAAHHYDNTSCFDEAEFFEDLNRFKYLKRLFNKYEETGELRERLILNHLVILYNMFGPEPTTRMLFLKMKGFEKYLKPFLVFLNMLPETVYAIGIEGLDIQTVAIPLDPTIIEALRKI